MKAHEVVAACVSPSRDHLERLIDVLVSEGLEHVFVMAHPHDETRGIEPIRGLEMVSQPPPHHSSGAALRGAGAGAAAGGAVAAGSLLGPFVWPMLLVTAPLAVLMGAGAGAIIGGGSESNAPVGEARALEDFDIPDPDIATYREALAAGGFFVAIKTDHGLAARAAEVFRREGAEHVAIYRPGQPPEETL